MWSRRRKNQTGPEAPTPWAMPRAWVPEPPDDAIAGRGPEPAASEGPAGPDYGGDPLAGLDLDHIRAALEELAEAHGAADPDDVGSAGDEPGRPDATARAGGTEETG